MLEILEPVCSALQVAHEHGIVHRDLKASNIFMATSGEKRTIKLLDFGIAKLMHPDASEAGLTVVGTRLGTSYTMAPEQIRGDGVDPRTDIYALGVVLYHLLTGQYPFRAETMTDIERQHLEAPPPRPSQAAPVSPAFDAVVLRCMEKTPERRFQSAKAFLEALREAVGSKSAQAETTARAAAIYVEIRIGEAPTPRATRSWTTPRPSSTRPSRASAAPASGCRCRPAARSSARGSSPDDPATAASRAGRGGGDRHRPSRGAGGPPHGGPRRARQHLGPRRPARR